MIRFTSHVRLLPNYAFFIRRYETMIEEEELFREWYRPHNERLYELLGREPLWQ